MHFEVILNNIVEIGPTLGTPNNVPLDPKYYPSGTPNTVPMWWLMGSKTQSIWTANTLPLSIDCNFSQFRVLHHETTTLDLWGYVFWGPRGSVFGIQEGWCLGSQGAWDHACLGSRGIVFGIHWITRIGHKMQVTESFEKWDQDQIDFQSAHDNILQAIFFQTVLLKVPPRILV